MFLIFHVLIALSSVAIATDLVLAPSESKFVISYALATLTIASGTLLTILNPAYLTESCLVGIVYLGIVTTATVMAERKFKRLQKESPHIYMRRK